MNRKSSDASDEAPLFSFVRFGPGAVTFLVLIAIMAAVFYLSNHRYLAVVAGAIGVVFVGVKSMERIKVSYPKERVLVGRTCLVVKSIPKGQQGIVKVFRTDGSLDPELWSAESASQIEEGSKAVVTGRRTVVLLVETLAEEK